MGKIISIPTAKLAKEKGFNLSSPAFYGCDEPASGKPGNQLMLRAWLKDIGCIESQEGTLIYSAPEQEMLKAWLIDVHQLYVAVNPNKSRQNDVIWYSQVFSLTIYNTSFKSFSYLTMEFKGDTYEDALELGLLAALQLIESKKTIIGYKCLLCGRDKFTRKSHHNCVGGFRKKSLKWEAIYKDE
jgi:hypothetical protein